MDLDCHFFYISEVKVKGRVITLIVSCLVIGLIPAAGQASYEGTIDYTNDRIVPFSYESAGTHPQWSGFLYSPRIVFGAAHSVTNLDSAGKQVPKDGPQIYVGVPNTKYSRDIKRVKVIKTFVSPQFRFDNAGLGDFAIYILESDLADVKPVRLMTREIEKELTDAKAFVKLHGFGEYYDRCTPGETLPCSKKPDSNSIEPRAISLQVRPYEDFKMLVGYERPQLIGELLTWQPGRISPCGGDSGGSLTTTYQGKMLYLSVAGNGMNGYSCGATDRFDGIGGIGYASPIYKHLDTLALAETYVKEVLAQEAAAKAALNPQPTKSPTKASTIFCVKGKTVKKVTKVNPVCPKGYTKKR